MKNLNMNSVELSDIVALLKQTMSKIHRFDIQYTLTFNRSVELEGKCTALQLELDAVKRRKCSKCFALDKYKRKTNEVKSRIMSLADMLNSTTCSIDNNDFLTDSLNSEIADPNKRKRNNKGGDDSVAGEQCNVISLSEYASGNQETNSEPYDDNVVLSSLKSSSSQNKLETDNINDENYSLIIPSVDLKQRMKSRRLGDLSSSEKYSLQNPDESQLHSNTVVDDSSGSRTTNCNNDINKSENIENNNEVISERKTWPSKKNNRHLLTLNSEKLKQMTLTFKVEREQNMSKNPEFNGGISQSKDKRKNCAVLDTSRNVTKENGKVKMDEDKELTKEKLDNSKVNKDENKFSSAGNDVILKNKLQGAGIVLRKKFHKPESPPYKYRRDALKNTTNRKKLPGQTCQQCYAFYEELDISDSQRKKMMNKCSRHRDKYPIRILTPPGFWNPRFDD